MRGKIEPDSDVDRYRIDVGEAGTLSVEDDARRGHDLALELHDAAAT